MSSKACFADSALRCCSAVRPLPRPFLSSKKRSSPRTFSTTPHHSKATVLRQECYKWLYEGLGTKLKNPLPGSTNYLNAYDRNGNLKRTMRGGKNAEQQDQDAGEREDAQEQGQEDDNKGGLPPARGTDLSPYPQNQSFRSTAVLSEKYREEIYEMYKKRGMSVSEISWKCSIMLERVAAVIRLKQMEKDWESSGKFLARPYSRAVLDMLPKVKDMKSLEPVTDLHVHRATEPQLWWPVSESRPFTRVDAGKAFDDNLLPADERVPHPEQVRIFREEFVNPSVNRRAAELRARSIRKERLEEHREKTKRRLKASTPAHTVPTARCDYRFTDCRVESVGPEGRSLRGVGARYGIPHEDRKRAQVKIPTEVDA